MNRHECDCGAVYSTAQGVQDCAKNFHGAGVPLGELADATYAMFQKGLGPSGYFPDVGKSVSDRVAIALRNAGYDMSFWEEKDE